MSKLSRYLFLKKMYPNYIIFILDKDKLLTYYNDLEIVNYLTLEEVFKKEINYIILFNLDIKIKKEFYNNHYFYYFKIILINSIINVIKQREV